MTALLEREHDGRTYELTGPRLMTFERVVAEVAEAAGRVIRYRPISKEQYAANLGQLLPFEVATFVSELFGRVLDGHNAHLSDGVERVLGRTPRDFSDFARRTAASGQWRLQPLHA